MSGAMGQASMGICVVFGLHVVCGRADLLANDMLQSLYVKTYDYVH